MADIAPKREYGSWQFMLSSPTPTKNVAILRAFVVKPAPIHHEDTKMRRINKRLGLWGLSDRGARACASWVGGRASHALEADHLIHSDRIGESARAGFRLS